MTLFGIEDAGYFLAAYIGLTYISVMIFQIAHDSVSSPGIAVFAILWPYFVARGFFRMFAKGWAELHPPREGGFKLGAVALALTIGGVLGSGLYFMVMAIAFLVTEFA